MSTKVWIKETGSIWVVLAFRCKKLMGKKQEYAVLWTVMDKSPRFARGVVVKLKE